MDLDHMQKQTTSLHSDTVNLTTDPEFLAAVLRSLVLRDTKPGGFFISLSGTAEVHTGLRTDFHRCLKPHYSSPIRTDRWTSEENNDSSLEGI